MTIYLLFIPHYPLAKEGCIILCFFSVNLACLFLTKDVVKYCVEQKHILVHSICSTLNGLFLD